MVLAYPPCLLRFTSLAWQIREVSSSGGASLTGSEQVVSSPAGRWYANLTLNVGAMPWNGSDVLLEFRALMARLRGRAGVIDLPYFDGRGPSQLLGLPETVPHDDGSTFSDGSSYEQGGMAVTLAAAAAMNAVTLVLTYPPNVRPRRGQAISLPAIEGGSWLHQISDLIAVDGLNWTVLVSPWLSRDYPAGTSVEVDRPTSRMRLLTDASGLLTVQAGQVWSSPTLEFVEAR